MANEVRCARCVDDAKHPRTRSSYTRLALALAYLIGEQRSNCQLNIRYAQNLGVTSDEIMQLVYLSIPAMGLWRATAAPREMAEFLASSSGTARAYCDAPSGA